MTEAIALSSSVTTEAPCCERKKTEVATIIGDDPASSRSLVSQEVARPALAPTFDHVYRETAPLVLRAMRRLVPRDLVEDAVQDVYVTVARRLSEFEGRSKTSTWIYAIVLKVASDHRRARRRQDRRVNALAAEPPPSTRSPEQHADRTTRVRLLHRVLEEMQEELREVFVLADLEELPGAEIASVLGLNPNTMYSRLRAARAEFNVLVRRANAREGQR
jgi:RNA polymerase sigma-70 factor, ECF subfamily